LQEVIGQARRTIALPLEMPFRCTELPTDSALVADLFTFPRQIDYKPAPDRPKVIPVDLSVEVTDPGTISGQQIHANDDIFYSQQPVAFQRYLELTIHVQV